MTDEILEPVSINGSFVDYGRELEFLLDSASLKLLSSRLDQVALLCGQVNIMIGGVVLNFVCAVTNDVHFIGRPGQLQITANRGNLQELARKLQNLSNVNVELVEHIDHIHLEPWFMDANEEITDIIFGRECD